MKGKDIVVWFSCGAASAVAAKLTIEKYGKDNNVRVVNQPIKEEHHDNRRFLEDVSRWIGQEIEISLNPKYPKASCVEVWDDRKFMSSPMGAPCTLELKKGARQHWERENEVDFHVLGFTVDEKGRADRFKKTERDNVLDVLIDEGLTKQDCMDMIVAAKINPPYIYRLGFPNANCIGCVKATSPTYWNLVREKFPEVFQERADQSARIGAKLVRVKGKRILLKDLDPNAMGMPLQNMDIDCGIFCEEDWEI